MFNSKFLNRFLGFSPGEANRHPNSFSLVHKWEHVEVFSAGFARALGEVLGEGLAAHGEEFASSVCQARADCEVIFNARAHACTTHTHTTHAQLYDLSPDHFVERRPDFFIEKMNLCIENTISNQNASVCTTPPLWDNFYHKVSDTHDVELCAKVFSNEINLKNNGFWF